ncbi:hypothetical protein EC973_002667 [Apophysomyces ossiformis]|uniref:Uncharacterized protein n=1 Tax=Apophysomyces ossiformis TaxID=679940 RepID=A0A8H7BND3_9FUNG|nr:hypothetical protein EC973_002667 [Apophysomyces ossiformis]
MHVRTAYQTLDKFDRIAQKRFAKHAVAISNLDLELAIMKQVELHPRVLMHLPEDHRTLDVCGSSKDLIESKRHLLASYDALAGKTLKLRQDMSLLYEQAAEINVQRTASEAVSLHAETMLKEIEALTRTVMHIQQKLDNKPLHQIPRSSSFSALPTCRKTMLLIRSASEESLPSRPFTEELSHLSLHDFVMHRSLQNIMEEKRDSVMHFFGCIQQISTLEETVSALLSRVADLEEEIVDLGQRLRHSSVTAKAVLTGYGSLLIEIWRRDAYTEVVLKNAKLFNELFTQFAATEHRYRNQFKTEVIQQDETWINPEGSVPVVDNACTVVRRDIEYYIQKIRTFCKDFDPKQGEQFVRICHQLSNRFKREQDRLNRAVGDLALTTFPRNITSMMDIQTAIPIISTASVQEWELERAVVMRQLREFRERTMSLETKIEDDRKAYEKDRTSLLRHLKTKETLLESRVQDVEKQYSEQIQELQKHLKAEQQEHKEDVQYWRQHYDNALQMDRQSYHRRRPSFNGRLLTRNSESEHAQAQYTSKSAPTSPRLYPEVQSLKQELEKARMECAHLKIKCQQFRSSEGNSVSQRQIEILTAQVNALELQQQELKEKHRNKIKQLHESFEGDLNRLKGLFTSENQEVSLHNEARIQNLVMEYQQTLREMKEQYESEKEVLRIEHQASVDQLRQEHEEAKYGIERMWEEKMEDMRASMSNDATEIQKHWEQKLNDAAIMQQQQLERLQAEVDILQERLVKEKEGREQAEESLNQWQQRFQQSNTESSRWKKIAQNTKRELSQRQQEQTRERRLAIDLLSIADPDIEIDPYSRVVDILQRAIRNVSVLRNRQSIMEQAVESSSYIMNPPAYGF